MGGEHVHFRADHLFHPFADAAPGPGFGLQVGIRGEIQGVAFHLRIKDACKDGSKVTIRLKGLFEEDRIVKFRLNDSDWRKSFVRELKSGNQEAVLTFSPEDGQACHPYVDEVYVEAKADVAANSENSADNSAASSGDPEGVPGN